MADATALGELTLRDEHRLRRQARRLRRGNQKDEARLRATACRGAGPGASAGARRSLRSPIRRSCRCPRVATICWPRSAITRSWSWPGRPVRARRRSCPSSASNWGAACAGPSPTPSRGGLQRGPWPSGSPMSSMCRSAAPSVTRSALTIAAREDTLVRLVTDGLLLAEIRRDPLLRRYDTVIVDEAHERSLNIDFLLGCLHRILPRRRDLKLIITSATIDPERFSEHFGGAPIVEVSGRTYPGRGPLPAAAGRTRRCSTRLPTPSRSCWASATATCSRSSPANGRSATRRSCSAGDWGRAWRCCPCTRGSRRPNSRRSSAGSSAAGRRVVLATNVAETSLTVPGIRFVVDTGVARISRYSTRLKVQRLPIEPISRASADQRKGRCGRVADGICVRLYSEADFEARPEFTDPEVLRTNLASVILQMASLGLGDIEAFPFLQAPDRRQVARRHRSAARAEGPRSSGRGAAHSARAQAGVVPDRSASRSHGP